MKSHIFPVIEIIKRMVVLVKTAETLNSNKDKVYSIYPHKVSIAGGKEKKDV